MSKIKSMHPGEYIKDLLEAKSISIREFALDIDITEETISSIINGTSDIDEIVASKLASYFDSSVNFWINLQKQYNEYKNID